MLHEIEKALNLAATQARSIHIGYKEWRLFRESVLVPHQPQRKFFFFHIPLFTTHWTMPQKWNLHIQKFSWCGDVFRFCTYSLQIMYWYPGIYFRISHSESIVYFAKYIAKHCTGSAFSIENILNLQFIFIYRKNNFFYWNGQRYLRLYASCCSCVLKSAYMRVSPTQLCWLMKNQ